MKPRSVQRRVVTGAELVSKSLPTVSRPLAGLLIGVKANRVATLIDMKMIEEIVVEMGSHRAHVVTLESVNRYLSHRDGHPVRNLPIAWTLIVDATRCGERLRLEDLLFAFGWSPSNPHARTRAVSLLVLLTETAWTLHKLLLGMLVGQSVRADYPHQKIVDVSRRLSADLSSSRQEMQDREWEAARAAVLAGKVSTLPPATLTDRPTVTSRPTGRTGGVCSV